ncbi:hypothetical protein WJX73_004745 [Symbiochloris irregularis]|uniref:Uncharacterized protein n=1 Tax=Symbiochloris irregularis TaxID=706552 RepID=A0AAW1NTS1_9CHLO
MEGRPSLRRHSETSAASTIQPAVKVVGFHVEGVPQSPAQEPQLLQDLAGNAVSPSPNPVIIPPAFQSSSPSSGSSLLQRQQTMPAKVSPFSAEDVQPSPSQPPSASASAHQMHILGSHSLPHAHDSALTDIRRALQHGTTASGHLHIPLSPQKEEDEEADIHLRLDSADFQDNLQRQDLAGSAEHGSSAQASSVAIPIRSSAGASPGSGPSSRTAASSYHGDPTQSDSRVKGQLASRLEAPTPVPSPAHPGIAHSHPAASPFLHEATSRLMRHSMTGRPSPPKSQKSRRRSASLQQAPLRSPQRKQKVERRPPGQKDGRYRRSRGLRRLQPKIQRELPRRPSPS